MRKDNCEPWSAEVTMAAGDATKTILAAKTGKKTVVTHLVYHVITSAAQAVDIAIGTMNVKRIAASEAVGSEGFIGPMDYGLVGASGTALVATPAAAGPAIHFVAEGYYL